MKINYFFVGFTFLVATFLTIMPLPTWAIWLRPQWFLMTLLFWVITSPGECGIILAWMVGIFMDLVMGTPMGQQSFIFVLLIYCVLKFHHIIFHSPRWQQAFFVGVIAALNIVLRNVLLGFTGHSTHIGLNGLSVITTILIWPWVYDAVEFIKIKQ